MTTAHLFWNFTELTSMLCNMCSLIVHLEGTSWKTRPGHPVFLFFETGEALALPLMISIIFGWYVSLQTHQFSKIRLEFLGHGSGEWFIGRPCSTQRSLKLSHWKTHQFNTVHQQQTDSHLPFRKPMSAFSYASVRSWSIVHTFRKKNSRGNAPNKAQFIKNLSIIDTFTLHDVFIFIAALIIPKSQGQCHFLVSRFSVISGTLPRWAVILPKVCPFLFSPGSRGTSPGWLVGSMLTS